MEYLHSYYGWPNSGKKPQNVLRKNYKVKKKQIHVSKFQQTGHCPQGNVCTNARTFYL